ncbi:MAG: membrane protein insertion efficiency factor YidD [bacterium]|nr:membrane protein insertion efficiency factor YidD [bacterium]
MVDVMVTCIGLYQKTISPDKGILRNRSRINQCRFFPSCSDYAIQSLRQYGLSRGIMVSMKRILRCNPFCAGGYDPIV